MELSEDTDRRGTQMPDKPFQALPQPGHPEIADTDIGVGIGRTDIGRTRADIARTDIGGCRVIRSGTGPSVGVGAHPPESTGVGRSPESDQ